MVWTAPIVVGFDGSAQSAAAASWAGRWGAVHGQMVLLLGVVGLIGATEATRRGRPASAQQLRVELERVAATVRAGNPGLAVQTRVAIGVAAEHLIAESRKGRLVAIGNRGIDGAPMANLLGSVAGAVVSRAASPVAVVPFKTARGGQTGLITVGVDSRHPIHSALRFSLEVARRSGGRVRVLAASEMAVAQRRELDRLRMILEPVHRRFPEVPIEYLAVPGEPDEVLASQGAKGELLVVGNRGRGQLAGLFLGSTSRRTVRRAHVPTIVVRASFEPDT